MSHPRNFCSLLLVMAVGTLLSAPASARVSLEAINAKLDALLAQSGVSPGVDRVVVLTNGSNLVTTCANDRAYFRQFPDGSVAPDEFVVPAGHTLLLNDVSWSAFDTPTAFVNGRALRLFLSSRQPDGSLSRTEFLSQPIIINSGNNDASLGGNESMSTGIPIGSGRIVCASVSNSSQSAFGANRISQSYLRGVLIPD